MPLDQVDPNTTYRLLPVEPESASAKPAPRRLGWIIAAVVIAYLLGASRGGEHHSPADPPRPAHTTTAPASHTGQGAKQ
ncbi:hypothetical protein [Streptomyces sp. NPDC048636]|uniref:hypothetical protein n=1 Tax=Streptomyces sp. NPDC048636 TaxID=3155762 RepID=UPI0034361FB6